MRRLSVVVALVAVAGVLSSLPCLLSAFAAEPAKPAAIDDPNVQQAQAVPDVPITQPSPELAAVAAGSAPAAPTFGSAGAAPAGATQQQQAIASQPSANTVGGGEALTRPSSDVGDLLGKSDSSTGVEVQRRNPITTDPRVRGYHVGQLITQADGAYWVPARQDLDTIVSKIDSSLIQSVVVLKGPYSVRYGPGFSFIDVETLDTPRYEDGWQLHGTTAYGYKTNGQQQHGRQSLWGGTDEWGFRLGWDIAVGNDYESGNDTRMPSSYNSQNWNYAFGYTISPDSRIEFRGLRLDQHDVEFPGIVFDINRLITDGYSARYTLENQCLFDRLTLDGWYNYTRFSGDDLRSGKRRQVPQLDQQGLFGFTQAHVISTGFREATTWGKEKDPQLTLGVDLRYLSQYLNEFDIASAFPSNNFAIPKSHSANPGLFIDNILPWTETLTFKSGARVDLVSTDIDRIPPPFGSTQTEAQYLTFMNRTYRTSDFENDYFLWSAFSTAEYKVTPELTALVGFGYAQRPPTITELYALQPFLAVLQNGLNFVNGNPELKPEQAMQLDVGFRGDFGRFRAGINGFYAWIHNYITFETIGTIGGLSPDNGLGVRFVNTDHATLAGAELYGEYDLSDYITPFATMSYVEGRDHTRDQRGDPRLAVVLPSGPQEPLPGIPPLEARLGFRLHEASRNPRWGVEFTARIVDEQDRFAQSLAEVGTPGFTIYDVRSYWQAREGLLLTAGVENLGNKNYREHLDLLTGYPLGPGVLQPGVNFYFGAQLTY